MGHLLIFHTRLLEISNASHSNKARFAKILSVIKRTKVLILLARSLPLALEALKKRVETGKGMHL